MNRCLVGALAVVALASLCGCAATEAQPAAGPGGCNHGATRELGCADVESSARAGDGASAASARSDRNKDAFRQPERVMSATVATQRPERPQRPPPVHGPRPDPR
ncbi:MAG: hypothetical protein ACRELB_06805 [Polyangiaceae bacterium]